MTLRTSPRKKWGAIVALGGGVALTLGGMQLANAGTSAPKAESTPRSTAVSAFAKTEHLDFGEAKEKLELQSTLVKTDKKLRTSLKSGWSAGNWIDQKTGKLVVAVTDRQHAASITAAHTETRVVDRSAGELENVKKSVAKLAHRFTPSGVSWYVDIRKNVVSVTAAKNTLHKGRTKQFLDRVRALGPAVRISTVDKAATPTEGMRAGDQIGGGNVGCSLGWPVRNKEGKDLIMTAGHCVKAAPKEVWNYKGQPIGSGDRYNLGPKDWGTLHADGKVTDGVDLYDGGSAAKISGYSEAPVGTEICKSGNTTQRTCGPITGHDISMVLQDGTRLEGMSQAKVIADHGDSGGPVYQMDPNKPGHVIAQGITSASAEGKSEGEALWYQPLDSALRETGASLLISGD